MTASEHEMHHSRQVLWFTVPSGPAAGEVHLAGWWLTAVGSGPHDVSGYYALASCPLCGALVPNNQGQAGANFGQSQRLHEAWHAANDYPRPATNAPSSGGES